MGYLDPAVIASVVNANGSFVIGLLGELSPSVLTGAINTNAGQTFLTQLLNPNIGMDPLVMARGMNQNQKFTEALMDPASGIDAWMLAAVLNNPTSQSFLNSLIGNLNAGQINTAMRNAIKLSYKPDGTPQTPSGMFYDLVKPYIPGDPQHSGIDPKVIAGIVNNNPTFIGELMGAMEPYAAQTAQILNAAMTPDVHGYSFLNSLVTLLNGDATARQNIANALANPDALTMSQNLMLAMGGDSDLVGWLADELNYAQNDNKLRNVTFKIWSDPASMPQIWGVTISPYLFGNFRSASNETPP